MDSRDDGDPPPERDNGSPVFAEAEEEDEGAIAPSKPSPSPSSSPSASSSSQPHEPSASPPPAASNGRITVSLTLQPERNPSPADSPSPTPVTAPEPAPLQVLALAVPSQKPFSGGPNSSGGGGGGGGREDYWTESATEVLIDAWAERYVGVTKGSMKQNNWKEEAEIVNGCDDRGKIPRSDIQCKNRIDTVKKKYRIEKARVESGGGPSNWKFFEKMDRLLGHTVVPGMKSNAGGAAVGTQSGKGSEKAQKAGGKGQRSKPKSKKRGWGAGWGSEGDSDDEDEDEEEEQKMRDRLLPFPPLPPPLLRKIPGTRRKGTTDGHGQGRRTTGTALVELTRAIESFGEVYEKTERAKIREVVEMEVQRMKFAKEMEVQRMQFFMKTQVEIAKHVKKKARRDGRSRSNDANATGDQNGGDGDAD